VHVLSSDRCSLRRHERWGSGNYLWACLVYTAAAVYCGIEVMRWGKGMTQALWERLDGFIGGFPSFPWIINKSQGGTEIFRVMLMDFSLLVFVLLREMRNCKVKVLARTWHLWGWAHSAHSGSLRLAERRSNIHCLNIYLLIKFTAMNTLEV